MTTITVNKFNCLFAVLIDLRFSSTSWPDRTIVSWQPQVNKLPHFTPLTRRCKYFNDEQKNSYQKFLGRRNWKSLCCNISNFCGSEFCFIQFWMAAKIPLNCSLYSEFLKQCGVTFEMGAPTLPTAKTF